MCYSINVNTHLSQHLLPLFVADFGAQTQTILQVVITDFVFAKCRVSSINKLRLT